jgi:hypothetical protein
MVDDFVVGGDSITITDFHWPILIYGLEWVGLADVLILADNAGVPGATLHLLTDVSATLDPTGSTFFGFPMDVVTVLLGSPITLQPGTYWLGLRPVGGSGSVNVSFWVTAAVTGSELFGSDDSMQTWDSSTDMFGTAYDVAFCITGTQHGSLCLEYLPGDANMHVGVWPPEVIGGDVTYLVNYFRNLPANPACWLEGFYYSGDANGDCQVIGADVTRLVTYFRGLAPILYCDDFEPCWGPPPNLPDPWPPEPDGWPNCGPPPPGN